MAVYVAVGALSVNFSLDPAVPEFLEFQMGRFAAFEGVAEPTLELGRSPLPPRCTFFV